MNINQLLFLSVFICSACTSTVLQIEDDLQNVPVQKSVVDSFDPLNDQWWIDHVGYKDQDGINRYAPENILFGRLVLLNDISFSNKLIRSTELGPYKDSLLIVTGCNVSISNCILKCMTKITTFENNINKKSHLTIVHSTFAYDPDPIKNNGITGLGGTLRFNFITANVDGIAFDGGLTDSSLIEYNWIKGPGKVVVAGTHCDGIQFNREGYATIRRNKIGGFDNACIMIGSALKPRAGNNPVEHITITENYFVSDGLKNRYIYVREKDPDIEYMKRPRFITITNNWFADKSINPISTGVSDKDRAMFVRTESERREGIKRQEAYPEVLVFREKWGYHTAVDARTWIVWNNNRWNDPELTEIPPQGGKWYDLTDERAGYPLIN